MVLELYTTNGYHSPCYHCKAYIQQCHYEELEINYIIYWVDVEIAYLQWAFQATDNISHAKLFAGHMARRPLTHRHW